MRTRRQREQLEKTFLAPYAVFSQRSKGRHHAESEHPYRTCFERDRDRVIHCSAFRRLEYKTQVFVIHEGDYYRTRLTHSLEVSQIAKTIAHALALNVDLTETVALAHDLGHGPFGHAGQDALNAVMEPYGGFDHNLQVLRIVELLEERTPEYPGLNLTWEVRDSLNKHRVRLPSMQDVPGGLLLEAQVVDLADELAYDHHDLDDGLTSKLIREDMLRKLPLWAQVREEVASAFPELRPDLMRKQMIRRLIDLQVTDVIKESERRIKEYKVASSKSAQACPKRLIASSDGIKQERASIKQFLHSSLYHHSKVERMSDNAHQCLTALFALYMKKPSLLPSSAKARMDSEDLSRVVCDYIAGMTDRFAQACYQEYCLP